MNAFIVSTSKFEDKEAEPLKGWEFKNGNSYNEYKNHDDDVDLARANILISWASKITPELLGKMKNLEAIQALSAGVDTIAFRYVPENVRIFSNVGPHAVPVAEHAWALILGIAKGINKRPERVASYLMEGQTLLVLGCGYSGSCVAKIGKKAFDMKTIGISRSFLSPEFFDEKYGLDGIDKALDRANVIVNTFPLNQETINLLTYDRLLRMREDVIIVNVARAETIDEETIYRVLVERPKTRFATDVFVRRNGKEDFDSRLWNLPNFMGTVHAAGADATNKEVHYQVFRAAAENVRLLLTTGNAKNEVKKEDFKSWGRQPFTNV